MTLKRKIPKLAAAAVALTGCGDAAPTLESTNRALCTNELNCSPENFDFSSVQECTEYYVKYYSEYLAGASAACVDAFVRYFDCAARLPCEGGNEACDPAYEALATACDF